jgi:uncharacterized membrane protein
MYIYFFLIIIIILIIIYFYKKNNKINTIYNSNKEKIKINNKEYKLDENSINNILYEIN